MPETTGRFGWTVRLSRTVLIATLIFLGIAVIAAVSGTVVVALTIGLWPHIVTGIMAVLGIFVAAGWAYVIYAVINVLAAAENSAERANGRLERIETLLEKQGEATNKLIELTSLSDRAKTILSRDKELEEFRDRIHAAMMRQDYKAAETIIAAIESAYGYAEEADKLRKEIEDFRKASVDDKIDAAVGRILRILDSRDWDRAIREARRLIRLFPENPKIAALPGKINSTRARQKRDLLQEYGEAVKRNDVDHSIELLKELDQFLTPQEGAALQESARGVFRAKLHNLGVQFAICVTDEQWAQALSVGNQIVEEYPNSRMAHEVRSKLDQLNAKAAAQKE